MSLNTFIENTNYVGVSNFFTYLPEQMQTLVNDPNMQAVINNNVGITSNHFKYDLYSTYFDLDYRKKLTGFEELADDDTQYRNVLTSKYGNVIELEKEFKKEDKLNMTFKEACILAAKKMYVEANSKNIFICLSGGIDSELVAQSFIAAGVPFTAYIVDYKGKNSQDIKYAEDFCAKNNVNFIKEEIDVIEFWKSKDFLELAEITKASSPQLVLYQFILKEINEKYNAFPIFAGEFRFKLNNDNKIAIIYNWKSESHTPPDEEK